MTPRRRCQLSIPPFRVLAQSVSIVIVAAGSVINNPRRAPVRKTYTVLACPMFRRISVIPPTRSDPTTMMTTRVRSLGRLKSRLYKEIVLLTSSLMVRRSMIHLQRDYPWCTII